MILNEFKVLNNGKLEAPQNVPDRFFLEGNTLAQVKSDYPDMWYLFTPVEDLIKGFDCAVDCVSIDVEANCYAAYPGWNILGDPSEVNHNEKILLIQFGDTRFATLTKSFSVPGEASKERIKEGIESVDMKHIGYVPEGVWMLGEISSPFLSVPSEVAGRVTTFIIKIKKG